MITREHIQEIQEMIINLLKVTKKGSVHACI